MPSLTSASVKAYLYDTFVPKIENKPKNPIALLTGLNHQQRLTFAAAFMAWMVDAVDFFTVSLSAYEVSTAFDRPLADVTSAITTTLMLRSIGALIFGVVADRYGRRIPLMIDLALFTVVEIATGFSTSLPMFIGLRGVFGICMGGAWGLASALAMESLPHDSRGIFSGILQEGYAAGYLVAALIYYAAVPHLGWRSLYWISIIPALIALVLVYFVPETDVWKQNRAHSIDNHKRLYQLTVEMLKQHWRRCIYAILLMAGFNFMSHGSQDLYPTFLKAQLGYTASQVTVATVVMNIGAIIGGLIVGYLSEYYGRRTMIIWSSVLGLCFLPLWMLPTNYAPLVTGAFFMQFCVQGAWGVIPVHLAELSPPGFRSTFPGLAYQLGNLISASASQIEAVAGAHHSLPNGKPDYATVQMILMGVVFAVVIFLCMIGTEERGKDFMASDGKDFQGDTDNMEETSQKVTVAGAIDGEEKGVAALQGDKTSVSEMKL
ncbi:MFS transporter, SHS family, lactate transporter [Entomortierella parvispora]|uniref:MFS transporter, SHS family, lactate transporter n=1 Tax=Entomortierella parvispora TaxID=205924 RepID=A0A9P3H3L7_9FUNG|nr:MFS transporter, SHS family, lactate transporter [Entomortierella parvispora]